MRITNKYWATSYESENVLNFIIKKKLKPIGRTITFMYSIITYLNLIIYISNCLHNHSILVPKKYIYYCYLNKKMYAFYFCRFKKKNV